MRKKGFKRREKTKRKISKTMKRKIKNGEIVNAFSKGEKHSKYFLGKSILKKQEKRFLEIQKKQ